MSVPHPPAAAPKQGAGEPPPRDHDAVLRVARLLVAAHDPSGGPTLVRIARDRSIVGHTDGSDDLDLPIGVLPVPEGLDPFDLLAGAETPTEWDVLGLVFAGRMVDLPRGSGGRARRRPGSTVGAVLVHRDGSSASVLDDGADVREVVTEPTDLAPVGRLADALRRSLGLPTAPPGIGVGALMARVWLHRVHCVAVDGCPPDAEVVVALRPPMPRSWSELRDQCAGGGWVELSCDPELAEWMDDGMFSRWCMGAFPDPIDVLGDLTDLVDPRAARPLSEALAAWR